MQYNCQKSSNFQGLSHFSRIFAKNDKIPGFFQAGKTVTIFPGFSGFPGAVGTLSIIFTNGLHHPLQPFFPPFYSTITLQVKLSTTTTHHYVN